MVLLSKLFELKWNFVEWKYEEEFSVMKIEKKLWQVNWQEQARDLILMKRILQFTVFGHNGHSKRHQIG